MSPSSWTARIERLQQALRADFSRASKDMETLQWEALGVADLKKIRRLLDDAHLRRRLRQQSMKGNPAETDDLINTLTRVLHRVEDRRNTLRRHYSWTERVFLGGGVTITTGGVAALVTVAGLIGLVPLVAGAAVLGVSAWGANKLLSEADEYNAILTALNKLIEAIQQ